MKILFTADWHIKLGQKNVPKDWQSNRYHMLVDELNGAMALHNCDLHVIGGDILDRFDPSAEELELYFDLIAKLADNSIIFTGNHELVGKTHSVLFNMAGETTRGNSKVTVIQDNFRSPEFDIVDYTELHKKTWMPQQSKLLLTHVRAELPKHMKTKPDIDLVRFKDYELVVAGDLHSHENTQETDEGVPIVYPGSPLTTSFHRSRTLGVNGYLVVDTDTLEWTWHDLGHLPQLIRKTVQVGEELVADDYDRVIYEVEGNISELKTVQDSDLLDKKINKNVGKDATLDLSGDVGVSQELVKYLEEIQQLPEDQIRNLTRIFKDIIPGAN